MAEQRLLTDEEVFGGSQQQLLSDEEVFGTQPTERSWGDVAKDTALQLGKGIVGLGDTVAGLAQATPQAQIQRVLSAPSDQPLFDRARGKGGVSSMDAALAASGYGQASQQAQQSMEAMKSLKQQEQNRNVRNAEGFGGTLKALVDNPLAAVDTGVESLPGMVVAGGVTRQAAKGLLERGGVDALKAGTTKLATIGGATEGAQQAGQMLEQGRQQGKQFADVAPYAAGAAAADALIGRYASKIPGFRDAETSLATAGMGLTKGQGAMMAAKEVAKAAFGEGVLEELPQSMAEQIMQNLADGKPWDQGVAEAGAMGLVVGSAMGSGAKGVQQARDLAAKQVPALKLGGEDIKAYTDDELRGFMADDAVPATAKVKIELELNRRTAAQEAAQRPRIPAYGTLPPTQAENTPVGAPGAPQALPEQPMEAVDAAIARLEQERGLATDDSGGIGAAGAERAGSPGAVAALGQPEAGAGSGSAAAPAASVEPAGVPDAVGGAAPAAVAYSGRPVEGLPAARDPRSEMQSIAEQLAVLDRLQLQDQLKAAQAPVVPNPKQTGLPTPRGRSVEDGAMDLWEKSVELANAQAVAEGRAEPLPKTQEELYLHGLDSYLQQHAGEIEAATGVRPPRLKTVRDERLARGWKRIADSLEQALGVRPVAFSDPSPGAASGFELNGTAHVNLGKVQRPAVYTAMHELKHVVERAAEAGNKDAQAITKMIHSVYDLISPEGKKAYAQQYLFKANAQPDGTYLIDGKRLTLDEAIEHPLIRSEMTADFMGQRAVDPKFWDSLAKRQPRTFGEFVKSWLRTLKFMIKELRGDRSIKGTAADIDQHITDLQRAYRIAEDALLRWAKAVKKAREAGAAAKPYLGENVRFAKEIPNEPAASATGPATLHDAFTQLRRSGKQLYRQGDGGSARVRLGTGASVEAVARFEPTEQSAVLQRLGVATPTMFEVRDAKAFHDAIGGSKRGNKFAASVYVYLPEEYGAMRLFLADGGKVGFALKGDDIVSVFNYDPRHKGAADAMLELAVQLGGRRLDAFDTVLPKIYSRHGFAAVARTRWNDEFAPEGWDKAIYRAYNNGEPDVVFMAHVGEQAQPYKASDGQLFEGDDAYERAVARQKAVVAGDVRLSRTENNASGESAASLEALSRQRREKDAGQVRLRISRDGTVTPLLGPDAVDARARTGEVIVQRGIGKDEWTVLAQGDDVKASGKARAIEMAKRWAQDALPRFSRSAKPDDEKRLQEFAKDLKLQVGARVEYANLLSRNHDWAYGDGDVLLSKKTGKTYTIIGHGFTSQGQKIVKGQPTKQVPTYLYEDSEGNKGFFREEALLADKNIQNLTRPFSGVGNNGKFDPNNPDIRFARPLTSYVPNNPQAIVGWAIPDPTGKDTFIYEMVNDKIDLQRVHEAISKTKKITDDFDPVLGEELYHGRVAARTRNFLEQEVTPLAKAISASGLSKEEIEDYLLARHAPERNAQIAKVNPNLPDGGAGSNSKGVLMTTKAAQAYIATLPADKKAKLDSLAAMIDKIIAGTQNVLITEGLEKVSTIRAWNEAYKKYVPLFKDEANEDMVQHPIGPGFSVKGQASRRAMGSTEKVTDILGHVLMQREAAITRAEKNRVAKRIYAMALDNPNPNFWQVDKPPTMQYINPSSGLVVQRIDPMYKSAPNIIVVKVFGEDRIVSFNEGNERAARLVKALKNLDGILQFDSATGVPGKIWNLIRAGTRWVAAVNTQYNPLFAISNAIRDIQSAGLNLTTTPLKSKELKVLSEAAPAFKGIAAVLMGKDGGKWGRLYQEYVDAGGQTGYRELFMHAEDRAKQLQAEIAKQQRGVAAKVAHGVLDFLDGWNSAVENAVRLSAYANAREIGLSKDRAASLAKNLTVNFNRKGRLGREFGAIYAFLNASAQGTARMVETLKGPAGRRIILGGLMLGLLQGWMLAGAGLDDEDDITEYTKERNLIIPLGNGKFLMIPYPLGFHIIPTIGRQIYETAAKPKDAWKNLGELLLEAANAFNPLGGQTVTDTLSPTITDPIFQISANKDFKGDPIYIANDEKNPSPGFTRFKRSAYVWEIVTAKGINKATGGSDYTPGAWSPTPEELRFYRHQVGGGLLREIEKGIESLHNEMIGEKVSMTRVPLVNRLYGESDPEIATSRKYARLSKEAAVHEKEVKGRAAADVDPAEIAAYLAAHPEGELYRAFDKVDRMVGKLNKQRKELVLKRPEGWREQVREIDLQVMEMKQQLNQEYEAARRGKPRQD